MSSSLFQSILNRVFSLYRRSRHFLFLFFGLIPQDRACRFHPTCSQYCQEAFRSHSLLKAVSLCLFRFLRCHPFSKGGYDPVP